MMTREDMLQELELLPVWSQRLPLPKPVLGAALSSFSQAAVQTAQSVLIDSTVVEGAAHTLESSVTLTAASAIPVETTPQASVTLRLLVSDSAEFSFLLSGSLEDADLLALETLLQNIFKAMKVVCHQDVRNASVQQLQDSAGKVIVVMGEAAANILLGQSRTLEDWRSIQKQQQLAYQGMPVVVTYHPLHLLQNLSDKTKAWADLCRAKKILQDI
ncbi:MAG: hypothetical protein PHD12_05365 [Methylotenera sp.]|nr:hypothetical protein [Methylotenera sp.]